MPPYESGLCVVPLARHVLWWLALLGCGTSAAPATLDPSACDAAPRSDRTYGVPAIDALVALPTDTEPALVVSSIDDPRVPRLLFETDPEVLGTPEHLARLARALDPVEGVSFDELPVAARVVLQNDLWGAFQHLEDASIAPAIAGQLARIVLRLAATLRDVGVDAAPSATRALRARGLIERGSELASLQHERAYGLRRAFRVLERVDEGLLERALISQLVAIDAEHSVVLTDVAGEIESLVQTGPDELEGDLLELSRARLRCGPPAAALMPPEQVVAIPGLSSRPIFSLGAPAALDRGLCMHCHEHVADTPMSLPTSRPWASRWPALRTQLEVEVARLREASAR